MSEFADCVKFLDPRLIEDWPRDVVNLITRIVRYERYLDHLEITKDKAGSLPPGVETSASRSIQRTLADVQSIAALMSEWVDELELTGVMPHLVPALVSRVRDKTISPEAIFAEHDAYIESWMGERGMPADLWQWARQHFDLKGYTLVLEEQRVQVQRDGKTLGFIVSNDGQPFDAETLLGLPSREKPFVLGAAAAFRGSMQAVVSFYEGRAQMTAMNGVQVLPTGIAPIIIAIIIIALVAAAVGFVITALCINGIIRDRTTCEFGVALMLCGLAAVGVGLYMKVQENNQPDPNPADPVG